MRRQALVQLIVLAVVGGVLWWLGRPSVAVVLWCLAAALLVLGLAAPSALAVVVDLGTRFGKVLGHAIALTGMAVTYYTVFTAAAFWLRLIGRDPMKRAIPTSAPSFWTRRSGYPPDRAVYLKPYSLPHAAPRGTERPS